MAFMKWDDSLSVNVHEIDLQHQKLIGMINEFYEYVGKDSGQAFCTLLDSLVEYTQYHFSTEEDYFKKFAYPDAGSHIEMHKIFTDKALDVRNRLNQGKFVVSLEITTFLKEWLMHHIKETDKEYSKFFNDHGLS
ncbi:MAG: bacteriohemerythrin [Deltaproteobacteria bacterium]